MCVKTRPRSGSAEQACHVIEIIEAASSHADWKDDELKTSFTPLGLEPAGRTDRAVRRQTMKVIQVGSSGWAAGWLEYIHNGAGLRDGRIGEPRRSKFAGSQREVGYSR